jgi:hypothetical protein
MNTNGGRKAATSISIGRWKEGGSPPRIRASINTCGFVNEDVVLVQATNVPGEKKQAWLVKVEPASVERKLLIRRMNDELRGKTLVGRTGNI